MAVKSLTGHKEPPRYNQYLTSKDLNEDGLTLRIVDGPVMGYEWFEKGKDDKYHPIRVEDAEEIPDEVRKAKDFKEKPKRFWTYVVYNYEGDCFQVWKINQATIRDRLQELDEDKNWGNLAEYDITVKKTGRDLNTRYAINPVSKTKLSSEQLKMVNESLKDISLATWLEGKNAFLTEEE